MRLARQLKFDMCMDGAQRFELKAIVKDWHQKSKYAQSVPLIQITQEFFVAFEKCKYPVGCNVVAIAASNLAELPSFARSYDDDTQKIIRLCLTLALNDKDKRFFLASREPFRQFNIPQPTAYRIMRELVADKILDCEDKGRKGKAGGKAARYQWIAPLLDD